MRALPEYLAIDMPYEVFWEHDVWMAAAYRKAWKRKRENRNFEAYLQGTYFYDALVRVSPALHAFNDKPKPMDWLDEPYTLETSPSGDREKNIHGDDVASKGEQAGIGFMLQYMSSHNAMRKRKTEGKEAPQQ